MQIETKKPVGPYARLVMDVLDWRVVDGDETMSICPFHNDSDASFRFNVMKGIGYCFGCNWGGNHRKLIRDLAEKNGGAEYSFSPGAAPISALRDRLDKMSVEPDEVQLLPETSLLRYRCGFSHDYWLNKRRLRPSTIKKFELGADPVRPAVIIPNRTLEGGLVGVIARSTEKNPLQRYNYPKNFPKSSLLYGAHLLEATREIALTEGTIDAMKITQAGFPALAQYGSSITTDQVKLLKAMDIKSVILFYDCDPGGVSAQLVSYKKLSGIRVRRIEYDPEVYCSEKPKTCPCGRIHGADPGGLSELEIARLIGHHQRARFELPDLGLLRSRKKPSVRG